MPSCPAGHDSATADYCDVCGTPMSAGAPSPAPSSAAPSSGGGSIAAAPPSGAVDQIELCANCGGPRSGRFCEECGHDSMLPPPAHQPPAATPDPDAPAPNPPGPNRSGPNRSASDAPAPDPAPISSSGGWTATVRADHDWYSEMRERSGNDAVVLPFPPYCPQRRFDLSGSQVLIGRRNRARGVDPEIDLSGSPMDPGVSTLHAMLLPCDGGGWEVVDLGSTNGTVVGDGAEPIAPSTPVPLTDGDRIKIGAWTTITVSRGQPRT